MTIRVHALSKQRLALIAAYAQKPHTIPVRILV